jgi:hypothetical protein
MIEGFMTTRQASFQFPLSQAHIRRLLEAGTVQGVKAGHDWLVDIASLEHYMANRPKPGPKPKERGRRGQIGKDQRE